MSLELELSEPELKDKEYPTLKTIRSKRFPLEKLVANYAKKSDGELVLSSLKDFLTIQKAAYDKLSRTHSSPTSTMIATGIAAMVAEENLNYQEGESTTFFENKRVNYSDTPPIPTNKSLEIYVRSLEECYPIRSLEVITDSFFRWIQQDIAATLTEAGYPESERHINTTISRRNYHVDLSNKVKEKKKVIDFDTKKFVVQPGKVERKDPESEDNIYGHEHVKREFSKIKTIVANREYFTRLFDPRKLLHNYLLVGPPGTGKTTLVKDLAQKCGLVFMNIPCVELGSKYFSETASKLHQVYEDGRAEVERGSPGVLIFFDEFDQIAKSRGYGNSPENDSLVTTLNENLDGGSSEAGILTIAATNVAEMIDQAVRSKFRELYVGYPEDNAGVIGIHQTVIGKIERYAGTSLFADELRDADQYGPLLEFSHQDNRYKSGRVIDRILYNSAISKAMSCLGRTLEPVSVREVLKQYQTYDLESQDKQQEFKGGTVTA